MNPVILPFVAKFDISSPIVRGKDDFIEKVFFTISEEDIYNLAEVRMRVSYSKKRIIKVIEGNQNFKEFDESVLYVAIGKKPKELNFEVAFRILEALAYGFNDYRARESICGYYKFLAK